MAKSKLEGRLGLKDLQLMHIVATTKRAIRIWTSPRSIWSFWIRDRYVRCRLLQEVELGPTCSPICASIVKSKDLTLKCISCDYKYQSTWTARAPDFRTRTSTILYEQQIQRML